MKKNKTNKEDEYESREATKRKDAKEEYARRRRRERSRRRRRRRSNKKKEKKKKKKKKKKKTKEGEKEDAGAQPPYEATMGDHIGQKDDYENQ